MIESSNILSYITSARLGNGEWNGTTESFITHWSNQVRLYERQVPLYDHFSAGQKRIMLENAVAPIAELRQVKINDDLEKTKNGRNLTYEEYLSLLLSAATNYDIQFASKKPKRQVFTHSFHDHNDDDSYDDDPACYDIDAPVSLILANSTEQCNQRPGRNGRSSNMVRMPRDKWFNLDAASKEIWDKLDNKAKSIILGYEPPKPSTTTPFNSFQPTSSNHQRRINLHDMSAYDLVQALVHETGNSDDNAVPDPSIDSPDTTIVEPAEDPPTRLINAAKSSGTAKLPPGDI
jgi:hypothetical protein